MKTDNSMPIAGQWVLGIFFGTLALSAGFISMQMNWQFGLQASVICGVIFVLSDCAKIALPIVAAALGGWDMRRRIAWAIAIGISITAALSALLQDQAQHMKDGQAISRTIEAAQQDAQRARHELQAISETASVSALQQITDAKQSAAEREAGRDFCGPKCEALKDEHVALLERLGNAQRRDKLQARIDDATAAMAATPEKANGMADSLADMTGGDKALIATVVYVLVSIAQLAILELIATFSGDAGMTIRNAMRRNRPAKRPQRDATPAQPVATTAPKRATKAYYQERLEREFPAFADKVQRGELSVFAACVATGLRKPANAKKDWTKLQAYGIRETA